MIEQLDLINLSHCDLGFTDHPLICHKLQVRYLDRAIDLVAANRGKEPERRFCWTCESNNVVWEWWQSASSERRELFLEMVHEGWIEVCAMPFNHQPTLSAREWRCLAHWLPEELWQALRPRTIMQNDVNGFPRAGVMALMDVGAEFLWMGLNCDTGGSPMPQPSAFWWEMPDRRRIFVWNSITYPNGYFLFEPSEWRRGPLPEASDARYRPPARGHIFSTSPDHLRRAHEICSARLVEWRKAGFGLSHVAVSMTNMWRIDNDPPCALLPDFVAAWNAAGYMPRLSLTTPSRALDAIKPLYTEDTLTLQGEWTDWWANGPASTPRELATSRRAKRVIEALDSPQYKHSPTVAAGLDDCLRQLCLFDEHTWGSWKSAAQPDSSETKAHFAEKSALAYRSLALAELALGDANRALAPSARGIHVINPYSAPFTGWITLTDDCLRGDYQGAKDTMTGQKLPFDRLPGVSAFFTRPTEPKQFTSLDTARVFPDAVVGKRLRLWVENLEPHGVRTFRLLKRVPPVPELSMPEIRLDANHWPASVRWQNTMLFDSPIGDFVSLEIQGFAPRWEYKEMLSLPTLAERQAARQKCSTLTQAVPTGSAILRDAGPTFVYEQYLVHPRLRAMRRVLEVHKATPRVRLTVTINRLSKPEVAEVFYVKFPLSCQGCDVLLSVGGIPFRPGVEQLARTCRDYFSIDGQVLFCKGSSRVVLDCYDSALVALGGTHDGLMLEQLGGDLSTVYAVIYNNVWYTNFAGDESGVMEFAFDLYSTSPSEPGFAPEAFPIVIV